MTDNKKALRYNQGKIDLSLLPRIACEEEARVWEAGLQKYGRDNWKKLWGAETTNVVMASLLRHAFAILDGEILDEESGLDHAAHIRCNAAMLLEYNKRVQDVVQDYNDSAISCRFMEGTNTSYPSHTSWHGQGTIKADKK